MMVHNRDVLVNCIKRYYNLLVRAAYLDPNAIETPPPSGWTDEQLTVDILRALGRSEAVIDLLRHVPYIKPKPRYEVWEVTIAINYLRSADRFKGTMAEECRGKTVNDFNLMPDDANWPAGFISLTEGREACWWIIDTDEGVIFPAGHSLINSEAPDDQPWRQAACPRQYQDYFDEICDDIVSLKMVPVPKGEHTWYCEIVQGEDEKGLVIRRILWEYGWPDNFRRDAYLGALRREHPDNVGHLELLREHHPQLVQAFKDKLGMQ